MQDEGETSAPWSRFKRDLGVVLWSSFLAACIGTMLFFAYFDPELLARDREPPPWLADRMSGYAVGFFFFWFVTTISGTLVAFLIDTYSRPEDATNAEEKKS